MKIKIGDITIKQFHTICQHRFCIKCPLYDPTSRLLCKACLPGNDDDSVEIPDEVFNNEKDEKIIGTHWNSQQGPDGYRLQFETDNKTLYKYIEKAAQLCIDIANQR